MEELIHQHGVCYTPWPWKPCNRQELEVKPGIMENERVLGVKEWSKRLHGTSLQIDHDRPRRCPDAGPGRLATWQRLL